jgi:hypothetical protein
VPEPGVSGEEGSVSDMLIAKRDAARKRLERWQRAYAEGITEKGREYVEERISFWTQRVAELDYLIEEHSA